MKLIRTLRDYRPDAPLALAIGNFDGLHAGHRAVLARTHEIAVAQGLVPALLTFEPHPRRYFDNDAPPFRLQTVRDKLGGLRALGVQRVFALRFNAAFASISAEDFLNDVLRQQMQVRAVITGENFAFGKGRAGTTATLHGWGVQHGIRTEALPPVQLGGEVCSSTAIRHALAAGDVARAATLLTRPYTLSGRVRLGQQRGRTLGFPTANILPHAGLQLPRAGVYAARVLRHGHWHDAVANLGLRPTLGDLLRPQLEVHLFDTHAMLYGERLSVALLSHLRDEKRFDSLAALAHQIAEDASHARDYLMDARD